MKRINWVAAFIISVLLLPLNVYADNRALLIGVGQYKNESRADLPGIDKDLQAMREVTGFMGFRPDQVTELKDGKATLAGIGNAFRKLQYGDPESDRVLIYFSVHGSQVPDKNGDEVDQADEVLLPHDVIVNRRNRTLDNVLLDDDFAILVSAIQAKEVFIFIDSCHSGTAIKGFEKGISLFDGIDEETEFIPKFFYYPGMPEAVGKDCFAVEKSEAQVTNIISLSAARDDEKAVATPGGSLFTCGILHAVKKAAESGQNLTIEQLREETEGLITAVIKDPQKMHHPYIFPDSALAKANILVRSGAAPSPPTRDPYEDLENLADSASYAIKIRTNKEIFKVEDLLVLTCEIPLEGDVPSAGYLNVFNVDKGDMNATVLFPNKYHEDNFVKAGERISIPSSENSFRLRAKKSTNESLIVAFFTEKEINAYRDGYGKSGNLFMNLSDKTLLTYTLLRNFEPEAKEPRIQYGAAKVTVSVTN